MLKALMIRRRVVSLPRSRLTRQEIGRPRRGEDGCDHGDQRGPLSVAAGLFVVALAGARAGPRAGDIAATDGPVVTAARAALEKGDVEPGCPSGSQKPGRSRRSGRAF